MIDYSLSERFSKQMLKTKECGQLRKRCLRKPVPQPQDSIQADREASQKQEASARMSNSQYAYSI